MHSCNTTFWCNFQGLFGESEQGELVGGWLAQAGDAQAEQTQRTVYQFFAGKEETAEPVNVGGFGQGIFDSDLTGEGGEIAVADFDLDGVSAQTAAFEAARYVFGLGAEAGAEDFAVVGVLEKGFFAADAFDFIAGMQWAVVLAARELAEGWAEGADEGAEIAGVILQITRGANAGLMQDLLRYPSHAVKGANG